MAGYFGTEAQQQLQARAEAAATFVRETPGACQAGRTMGCDQPDLLGWKPIEAFLAQDRVCGFRLLSADRAEVLKAELAERNHRLDTWDVFVAGRSEAMAAADRILGRGLPAGIIALTMPTDPEGTDIHNIQQLMSAAGVVPFSGSFLTAAHAYFPHNKYSAHHRKAWGGLVAVAETQRGRGLGTSINALMIREIFTLGATHIYELVSSSNLPSRRMVEACGLRSEPTLVCGLAAPLEGARFTR